MAQARRVPIGPVTWPAELLRGRAAPGARLPGAGRHAGAADRLGRAARHAGAIARPRRPQPAREAGALPLAGLRVVDLGWLTAGAASATLLLDLGAEVVKVEGPGAIDPFRTWDGAEPDTDWWNRSPWFAFTNRGKRSLCLDLKDPRGREALLRLLEGADVLVENYRRGVLASFGLDAAMLRRRFPRLVIASISSQGEDGPDRDMVSFGSTLEATGGLAALTGSGEAPVITGRDVNYPDQVVCLFASGAILAALLERDRTGQGAHLDLSQRELTSFLLGEELLAAAAGVPSPRFGNADPADPAERVVAEGDGWRAEWAGGSAPVRDGAALAGGRGFPQGQRGAAQPGRPPRQGHSLRLRQPPADGARWLPRAWRRQPCGAGRGGAGGGGDHGTGGGGRARHRAAPWPGGLNGNGRRRIGMMRRKALQLLGLAGCHAGVGPENPGAIPGIGRSGWWCPTRPAAALTSWAG